MSDIKSKVQGIEANCQARNIKDFSEPTNNIYETINIIDKRAKSLAVDIKQELHKKLEEFAVQTDTIEEIHENKEQIEISKFYERMPNAALISTEEFLNGALEYRYKGDDKLPELKPDDVKEVKAEAKAKTEVKEEVKAEATEEVKEEVKAEATEESKDETPAE